MPLTKSEIRVLKSLERDAKKLANHATRLAVNARKKLLKEMQKS